MNLYIINYRYRGKTYSFDLYAKDREEAEGMLAAIKSTAEYEGEVFYTEDLPDEQWELITEHLGLEYYDER